MREVTLADLKVSALGLGCMSLTEAHSAVDHDQAVGMLQRAFDMGVRFWDTADVYGHGANERLIGEFLPTVPREEVAISTKFGGIFDPDTKAPTGVRGDAAYVHQACDESLRRLGSDHIDLYYQHLPDVDVPIEETVGAMGELVTAGKVRHIGLSNLGADQLRAAHRTHPIAAVQNEWNVFYRNVEPAVVPACSELGIAIVPYAPLGRGVLTGVYTSTADLADDDERHAFPRFESENAGHNAALLERVRELAAAHGATPAQIALAWLYHRAEIDGLTVVPIPGTKNRDRLEENAAAIELHLTEEDLGILETIAGQVAGQRLPQLPPELQRLMPEIA